MSDMEITIRFPEELVARAQAVGIDIDALTPEVVLALLEQQIERKQYHMAQDATFDYSRWWAEVESLQANLRAAHGEDYHADALDLLRELREDED